MDYAAWRACERFGVRPPNVSAAWDECNVMVQASLLAYDQIRQLEEVKEKAAFAGVKM